MRGLTVRGMIRLALYRLLQMLVNILPLSVSFHVADFFADVKFAFSRVDRVSVSNNLKTIVPGEPDVSRLTREVFRHFARYLVEFCWMKRHVGESFIQSRCVFQGMEHMDEAVSLGRGVLMITAHIGNWEMGGAVLSRLGYPVTVVAMRHPHPMVNAFFDEQRIQHGIRVVPMSMAARPCLRALKENHLVAMPVERDFTGHGVSMDFLDRKVSLPKGAAVLSLLSGAPIVPAFFVRRDPGYFDIMMYPCVKVEPLPKGAALDDIVIRSVMKQYIGVIESVIRRYPAQWLMMRDYGIE
jgi:lauroyl/myristoyl acyltransferase